VAVSFETLLFLHLASAFLFVGGSLAAALLRLSAMRRTDAREIAVLLRAIRTAVPLVGVGLLGTIAFGFALTGKLDLDYGSTWLTITFVLLGWLIVVGGLAGRQDRGTRELAERLADEGGDAASLGSRLRDPLNLALNLSLLLATIAIVALMVWRP
jgi:uncharacterized membrane protein